MAIFQVEAANLPELPVALAEGTERAASTEEQPVDPTVAGAQAPGQPAAPGAVLSLPGGYNPDPFQGPAAKALPAPPKATPTPSDPAGDLKPRGPGALPNPGGFGPLLPSGPGTPGPQAPVEPTRPTVAVTGIIDVEGGTDMALVEMGQNQRIVQVGDMLDTYKVKKIDMSGLVLVNGKDRYFVALASSDTEAGKG